MYLETIVRCRVDFPKTVPRFTAMIDSTQKKCIFKATLGSSISSCKNCPLTIRVFPLHNVFGSICCLASWCSKIGPAFFWPRRLTTERTWGLSQPLSPISSHQKNFHCTTLHVFGKICSLLTWFSKNGPTFYGHVASKPKNAVWSKAKCIWMYLESSFCSELM